MSFVDDDLLSKCFVEIEAHLNEQHVRTMEELLEKCALDSSVIVLLLNALDTMTTFGSIDEQEEMMNTIEQHAPLLYGLATGVLVLSWSPYNKHLNCSGCCERGGDCWWRRRATDKRLTCTLDRYSPGDTIF